MAGAGDGPGLVLIVGHRFDRLRGERAGRGRAGRRLGAALGDEGSGYWIGRRALAAVARDADGRGPQTRLTDAGPRALRARASASNWSTEIYDHAHGRKAVAALGAVVEQARAEGDAVATEILREAASELALAASSVVSALGMRGDQFPTLLSGGMLNTGAAWLASEVTRHLAEVAPRSTVSRLSAEPAIGAVHLALAEARGTARVPPYIDAISVQCPRED